MIKDQRDYTKTLKQFDHILTDGDYYKNDGYRGFITDMMIAMRGGRKITPKMDSAIRTVVNRYKDWLFTQTPDKKKKTEEFVSESAGKIYLIKQLLEACNYTRTYTSRSEYFLNSVEEGMKKYGKLSVKQRKALNSMYKRFKKRVEKK